MTTTTGDGLDLGYLQSEPHRRPDGVELYFEQRGTDAGPAVCVVNNTFVAAPTWRAFTQSLETRNRVVGYDLRGQGASSAVPEISVADHVDDLRSLLDALDIEQTYLIGSSTSTVICRDFALAHPERVKGMVLCGPIFNAVGGHRRKHYTRACIRSLELGGPAALFDHIYSLVFGEQLIETGGKAAYLALRENFLATNPPDRLAASLGSYLSSTDDPARLAEITCPVLLLAGDGDFLMGPSSLEALCRLLPDATAEVIPFAGHVAYFEATARFEELTQQFIDRVEGAQP